jgi:hypothetical protein
MRLGIVVLLGTMLAVAAVGQTEGKQDAKVVRELPAYPNAKPMDRHPDGRYTLMLKALDGYASGASYSSPDKPQQVLEFYRDRMKALGEVVECQNGTNKKGDLLVDEKVTGHPSAGNCYPENFAAGGTLLKTVSGATQRIVVVVPQGDGSEISLYTVRPEMY